MRAVRVPMGREVAPFGEHASALPVLGRSLCDVQDEVLASAGLERVDRADGPHLAVGDHVWLTDALLRRFLAACPATGGQLVIDGALHAFTAPLQGIGPAPARVPVAVLPGALPPERWSELPPVAVDLGVVAQPAPHLHPAFSGLADTPLPLTDAIVHSVDHWTHVLRVNLLAWLARAEGAKREAEAWPWWRKAWGAAGLVVRARGVDKYRLASALTVKGRGCDIHPTATVEASHLGDGVEVGPHAVVRGAWLGDGAKVGEHARVNLTVAMAGAELSRGVMANLCVLLPGAFVSQGNGWQGCLFGRDSFVAMGATAFDLSFGRDISVWHRGQRVPSGSRFLGACIGHRAKVGPLVVLGYGEEVPNDAFLLLDPSRVARRLPQQGWPDGPAYWDGEALRPVKRG